MHRSIGTRLGWLLITVLMLGTLLVGGAPAHAAIEQLAIWTFDGAPAFTINTPINPKTEDVVGTPALTLINADVSPAGITGVAYADSKGVNQPAGKAAGWTDIKKSAEPDAELRFQIDTTGWQGVKLRLDYRSDSANSYDLEYSLNGTDWTKALDDQPLTIGAAFHALAVDLPPAVANRAGVFLRIIDLDRNGNDGFYVDNLEFTGTRIDPTAPTIQVATTTTRFLSLPATGSGFVSGVISDPTDPAATLGVDFTLADVDTPVANLTVTATSSNPAVVPNTTASLAVSGSGATRTLKITPTGVGYATLTVTVQDTEAHTASYVIAYAASAAAVAPASARFFTGMSDASAALAVDAATMIVANDEDQPLRLFNRTQSGQPFASFDFSAQLGLAAGGGEMDIEGSTRVDNRLFWITSHGNNTSGELRPNRERVFATDLSGTGATATLSFVGHYDYLRKDMIAWDKANGHGLGANYLGLEASAAVGKPPESVASDGFNIEGFALGPNSATTAYVGFRAPLTPGSGRTKALIIPVTNFSSILNAAGGAPSTATFGAPIELDLGGRGIRSMERNASNQYLIVAGPPSDATGVAPKDFRLYTWTGNVADAPQLQPVDLTALSTGGSFEGIVDVPNPLSAAPVQLVNDNGDTPWYGDGKASKEQTANFQKFRTDQVTLIFAPTATTSAASAVTTTSAQLNGTVTANNAASTVTFAWGTTAGGPYPNQVAATPVTVSGATATAVAALLSGLTPTTTYYYHVVATNSSGTTTGNEQSFTTGTPSANLPTAVTLAASDVTSTGAKLNGTITANGTALVSFEWGTTAGGPYPNQLAATPGTVSGTTPSAVSALLTGLTPNTTYYYHVVATSSSGTTVGAEQRVTTSQIASTPPRLLYVPLAMR